MQIDLKPCPFCGKAMMLRCALWPSEGDTDAVIHAEPTDCPMYDFCDGTAEGSIAEKWNRRALTSTTPPDELSGDPGELIDKMAEAIRDWGSHYDDGPWETLPEDRKAGWRGDAERALAVVKEYLTSQAATALRLSAGGGRLWGDPEHERQRMLDHIEALKSENAQLREVLEPFAAVAEHDIGDDETDDDIFWPISNARYSMSGRLRVGHLRAARRAREGGNADG